MPVRPEPEGELDGPTCKFRDFKCLFSGGEAKKWWRGNRDWVTGTVGTIGVGVCIVATAGVCAVAGAAGLAVALGGRALDVQSSKSGWTQDETSNGCSPEWRSTMPHQDPGVRLFKTTRSGATVHAPRSARNPTQDYSQTWGQQFKPAAPGTAMRCWRAEVGLPDNSAGGGYRHPAASHRGSRTFRSPIR